MKLEKIAKKGMSLQEAPALVILLVVVGIVGGIGLLVIDGVGDSMEANSTSEAAINNATEAVANFFDLLPVLGTVFVAVILLAAVGALAYFAYMRNR